MSSKVRKRLGLHRDSAFVATDGSLKVETERMTRYPYALTTQGVELTGPREVAWIVDDDLKVSAQHLQEKQLTESLLLCRKHKAFDEFKNYGYWLALVQRDLRNSDLAWAREWQIKAPDSRIPEHLKECVWIHRGFLIHLGEIQKLAQRCFEAEYTLFGLVRDLRTCDTLTVNAILDANGVPKTNYVNVYAEYFGLRNWLTPKPLIDAWLAQDDSEINELHAKLEVRK